MTATMPVRLTQELSFDQTLGALQSLLGDYVLICVCPAAAPDAVVGSMSGRFTHAVETTELAPAAPEEWCLALDGEVDAGVFVDRSRFNGSHWTDDSRVGLEIALGELIVTIERWSL